MPNNKMLIDAGHPEETRVVMLRGNRVDEFDFESEHKTQLRGNIYLAKVTRVEPSLQAAFVDYGGNRHGFLAFSEIHPDYYQIPVADRQALLDADAEDAREAAAAEALQDQDADDAEETNEKPTRKRRSRRRGKSDTGAKASQSDTSSDQANLDDNGSESDEAIQQSQAAETTDASDYGDAPDDAAPVDANPAEKIANANALDEAGNGGDADKSEDTEEESDDDATSMSADNEGEDVVSEPAKPKKKTTRSPRKKKSEAVSEASDADTDKPVDATAEATSEEPPKRKRRRTSRVKANTESDVTAETVAEEPSADTDSNADAAQEPQESVAKAEKPKRRRTSRKKKTEEDAEASPELTADAAVVDESTADSSDSAEEEVEAKPRKSRSRSRSRRRKSKDDANDVDVSDDNDNGNSVEELGSQDAMEEVPARRAPRRHYKIQEVIKRRQILLVQVVKEERGNKGAALTTYLSLAGRYSVLMPNTARGGGISRKITNASDRKRLKAIASNLEVPQGMGVILRTAGASRQPEDIQRDFEYLMRLWENVRSLTLESTAPYLVYEEGSLIKRSIRDMYDKDTGEIMVAGDAGYREAKDFMTMLMPNHAKNVKLYRDRIPMFARMGVEAQLDAMLQPEVTLKSGGYIIIDQTEALVAIDVNSGRSTRQHSVEETAVQTNLEAADEVARQLRLRDLAGLIVIDFIDMEDKRNIRSVEKRLKEALKEDRARIQVGRISHFGLMEMSRQRIRASVLESTTQTCPTCEGLGHVRAASSVAISVLRTIEEQLNRNSRNNLIVKVSTETALYVLNNKRDNLGDLESRFNVSISIATDDSLGSTPCAIERGEASSRRSLPEAAIQPDSIELSEDDVDSEASDIAKTADPEAQSADSEGNGGGKKRRRRRRRRKGSDVEENEETVVAKSDAIGDDNSTDIAQVTDTKVDQPSEDEQEKPAGRVKRTRRTRAKKTETVSNTTAEATNNEETDAPDDADAEQEKPAKTRRKRVSKKAVAAEQDNAESEVTETSAPPVAASGLEDAVDEGDDRDDPAKPKRRTTRRKKAEPAAAIGGETITAQDTQTAVEMSVSADPIVAESEPKKSGWWQRKFF